MRASRSKLAALGAGVALAAAACSSSGGSHAASSTTSHMAGGSAMPSESMMPSSSMSGSGSMMPLPPGAMKMHTTITSPASGTVVTGNAVTLAVKATGYRLRCDLAGKPEVNSSTGHYHVLIDKSLINMYCSPTVTVSMQNATPGRHTLTVLPALNDHTEVESGAQSITIDYRPSHPLPTITNATEAGQPTITILSPKAGAVLHGGFDVVIRTTNWHNSCALYGKPAVSGYGHWHLNLDSTSGPMMGMGSMLGMSCTTVFHATTTGLQAGQKHTLIALLVDNGHAPLMPEVDDKVTVSIG